MTKQSFAAAASHPPITPAMCVGLILTRIECDPPIVTHLMDGTPIYGARDVEIRVQVRAPNATTLATLTEMMGSGRELVLTYRENAAETP